jgi:polysaccharide biosynthesis/export protein
MVSAPLSPCGIPLRCGFVNHTDLKKTRRAPAAPLVGLMRHFGVLVAIAASLAACGCAAPPTLDPTSAAPVGASAAVVASAPAPVVTPYKLASGDRLRVIVFGQDNLSNTFSVDSTGAISMPLIGRVKALGSTTAELERVIEARLRQGFIRDPSVSIEVETYRPFFILGGVKEAGQYPFISGMTVQNAIAVAGGFAQNAGQGSAEITRIVDGRALTLSEPLSFAVKPGDTITVE